MELTDEFKANIVMVPRHRRTKAEVGITFSFRVPYKKSIVTQIAVFFSFISYHTINPREKELSLTKDKLTQY